MKIYQIDSSARKRGSTSRALAKKLLDKIKKPEDEIIYRDLDDEMLFVSGLTESGMNIDEKDQTPEHKKMFELSDKLVSELKESDIIIISAPIYNYGPPATLKAWSDLAARVGETFRFKPNGRREGLLKNKRAYLVITSGGTKLNSNEDFLTPWLKFILNFFGIDKIDVISADQMALNYEKSISDAEKQIDKDIQEKFNEADSLRINQSYSKAIVLFNEILKKHPSFPPALNNIAMCYIGLKKFEEAEKFYLKCMEIKPVHIITINGYADLLAHTNKFQKAIPVYKESLKNNPNQEKIVEKLIHCLHEINQDNEVSLLCEKATKIYSKNKYISEIYGKTLLRLNRHKEAQSILDKTVGSIEFNEENFKVNS